MVDPGECPSEDALAELVENGLLASPGSAIEKHVAQCATCRAILAGVAGSSDGSPVTGPGVKDDAASEPPLVLGRYRLGELLGRGAMGSVYAAHDPELDRRVAVKLLDRSLLIDAGDVSKRLRREAQAMARLSHPNVVSIFDVGTSGGQLFIAMELVQGWTLRDWLAATPRSWRAILDVFEQAGRGLAAAHGAGLIHRDFKPDNVLVSQDGTARVTDFGLARLARAGADDGTLADSRPGARPDLELTRSGAMIGTPAYMAPEQLDRGRADVRSDQFSFCVALWEALSGHRPFSGSTVIEVRHAIREGALTIPEGAAPRAVYEALVSGLADDSARRYATMEALLDALRAAAEPAMPRVRRAKRRWLAVLGASCILALATGGALYRARKPLAPLASSTEPAPPARDPQALSAYQAGLQAARDAAQRSALQSFARAAAIDPSFAEAHLQVVLLSHLANADARVHYAAAVAHRYALSPRDAGLLEAFEPWIRQPQDTGEWERRLVALRSAFPGDPEVLLALCRVHEFAAHYADAIRVCDEAVKAEPRLAPALRFKALALLQTGDLEGGRAAYDECLRTSPFATACLTDRVDLDENEGRCAESIDSSRRLIALDPSTMSGYLFLAEAIVGDGRPTESAEVALEERWKRLPESAREEARLRDGASLAIVEGRLGDAAGLLDGWERSLAGSLDEIDHLDVLRARVSLALERGRRQEAAEIARAYLKRREAWTPMVQTDGRIHGIVALRRAGALTKAAFADQRDAWLKGEETRPAQSGQYGTPRGMRWIAGFAEPTIDQVDARRALDALPNYLPLPGNYSRSPDSDEPIGRVYLRAGGHGDEAIAYLRRAANACMLLTWPIQQTWASAELGQALEQRGERIAACDAYERVNARWGNARESVTAALSRDRLRALGCASRSR